MDLPIDATEIRSLERSLKATSRNARKETRDTVHKAGFEIERGGKQRAPVRTGMLRNSITTEFHDTVVSWEAETGPEVNYGKYPELGTERQAPQPYMGPSFDAVEPSFNEAIDDIAGRFE